MAINPIVDRQARGGDRQRLRKLAQAALNADQTVDQVEGILGDVGPVLSSMGNTIDGLDQTIDKLNVSLDELNTTLIKVDDTITRMADVVIRLERVTGRVEAIVAIAEQAFKPVKMLENAGHTIEAVGRGVASRIGFS